MEVSGQLHAPAVLPQRNNLGIHWIAGSLGPTAGQNGFGEQKLPTPHPPILRYSTLESVFNHN
jgi:hypothetical protein